MIYEERNGLRIIKPSDNQHKLMGYDSEDYYDIIYLGKYQNKHDYYEVSIYDIEGYEFPNELAEFEAQLKQKEEEDNERDAMIIDLATELAIIQLTL